MAITIVLFPTTLVIGFFDPGANLDLVQLTGTFMIFLIAGLSFTRAYREYLRPDLM